MVLKAKVEAVAKRSDKKFTDYNDYQDRPFGLKWGTAFALDELVKVIDHNKEKANKDIQALPLMSRKEIDEILQYALLKTQAVSIQLNSRDKAGNLKDNIIGSFQGFSDEEYLYIERVAIRWESIRNIQIVKNSNR